jgi:hypothetical protein
MFDQTRIERYAAWNWAAGGGAYTNSLQVTMSEADSGAIDQFFEDVVGTDALVIDDVDHTAVFAECRQTSGFVEPADEPDAGAELAHKNALVQASNAWVVCARENGFAGLADPDAPVADDYSTTPMVVLPATVTLDQVRVLLEACPLPDYANEYTEPAIGLDVPGFDGRGSPPTVTDEEYSQLMAILSAIYDQDPATEPS